MPEAPVALSVRDVLGEAVAALRAAGVDTPELDGELLLAHALGVSRGRLLMEHDRPVTEEALAGFRGLLARRVAREPVAYILGAKHFRWIELAVDARVLIPRPETELLVEVALAFPSGARVVDVGTGSGAVALALAFERPDLEVCGTDVSEDAIEVARENAKRLGLGVGFSHCDLLDGVPGAVDAVLANLPYVADGTPLEPEILRYEPAQALFAGVDGLDVIRRLVAAAASASIGLVALEIGPGQAQPVVQLLAARGYRTEVYRDLAGHERVLVARL